jgi:hypothetical protein
VDEGIDRDRRRFLGKVAMTMAAAQLGMFGPPSPLRGFGETGTAEANDREPRELAAIARATEWLNVPRLTVASLLGKVMLVLVRQPKPIVDRQFEIEFLDAGVETFAFTFG